MFQTTRRQLALWYTTVTAVLLLLFATGFYWYVRDTLIERIDDTLNHVVEVVGRSLVIEPVNLHSEGGPLRVNVEASFRDNAATDEDDHIDLEWFSSTGELLWSTFAEPLALPLHPNSDGETVQVFRKAEGRGQRVKGQEIGNGGQGTGGDASITHYPSAISQTQNSNSQHSERTQNPSSSDPLILRQVTHRIEIGRQVLGYLRVSHPWFEVTKPTRQLVFDLLLWTALIVAAVGAIGWFLSGLAMEPVRESYQRLKQFTADASHELRSPIAIIQTNVQVALADPDPQPQTQAHHLRVVERLTRRLGRLVDDLLFLARQDSSMVQLQYTSVALDELLKEVIEEQQIPAKEKEIHLTLDLVEPSTHTLQGDRDQLARLMTNLVGNAVKYTPVGGQVEVELQRLGRQGTASLQIVVRDTGIGIPPEALPHLFDRFYRVDPSRSQNAATGSGLGLAIAQAIVENHHGTIHIDSTPNQGTTVTVTLPQRS
ncbi:HAMP domain-containing histidine kinase [Kovacikia minuta CCNUW1]|uniref:sensor histidine kinase n=1 Tax=Kovacikia minuta TaxID=2931930 RepID=UPI001CCE61C1|nr:ATP-binding protein [Kovacikia minuta]UBF26053.1 HAMP domain-containing histidine kinase [Kovacikia minuta CCNUW1]